MEVSDTWLGMVLSYRMATLVDEPAMHRYRDVGRGDPILDLGEQYAC